MVSQIHWEVCDSEGSLKTSPEEGYQVVLETGAGRNILGTIIIQFCQLCSVPFRFWPAQISVSSLHCRTTLQTRSWGLKPRTGVVVIAFASHLLNNALVWGIQKFKPYLEGYHFTAITDHVAFELVNVARFTQLGMLGDGTLAVRRQDKVPKGGPKPCCRHFV